MTRILLATLLLAQTRVDVNTQTMNSVATAPGSGIVTDQVENTVYVSADSTVVPFLVAMPLSSSAPCLPPQFALSPAYRYDCIALNTWVRTPVQSW